MSQQSVKEIMNGLETQCILTKDEAYFTNANELT